MARTDPSKVLRMCFSDAEWQWLKEESAFVEAAKSVKNLDDVEHVSRLGDHLLELAKLGEHPAKRKPPGAESRMAA